jgi:hypothetical protein
MSVENPTLLLQKQTNTALATQETLARINYAIRE